MRYRFFLSFLGSSYFGMQRQKGKATVQQKVEETLSSLTGEDIEIKYSGRTDAGVSAAAMPAAFSCSRELDCSRMESLLNRRLPKDIAVFGLERCGDSFKPRQDSVGKRYSYTFSLKRKFPLRCHSCLLFGFLCLFFRSGGALRQQLLNIGGFSLLVEFSLVHGLPPYSAGLTSQ